MKYFLSHLSSKRKKNFKTLTFVIYPFSAVIGFMVIIFWAYIFDHKLTSLDYLKSIIFILILYILIIIRSYFILKKIDNKIKTKIR